MRIKEGELSVILWRILGDRNRLNFLRKNGSLSVLVLNCNERKMLKTLDKMSRSYINLIPFHKKLFSRFQSPNMYQGWTDSPIKRRKKYAKIALEVLKEELKVRELQLKI